MEVGAIGKEMVYAINLVEEDCLSNAVTVTIQDRNSMEMNAKEYIMLQNHAICINVQVCIRMID